MKILGLILIVLCGGTYAQPNNDKTLVKTQIDSSKINELIILQSKLIKNYPDSAINITFEALQLSRKLAFNKAPIESFKHLLTTSNDDSLKIHIYLFLYDAYSRIDQEVSLEYVIKAEQLADRAKLRVSLANSTLCKGRMLFSMSRYQEAEKSFKKALVIFSELNDKKNIGAVKIELARFFQNNSRTEDALNLYLEALFIAKEIGNRNTEAKIYNYMAGLYAVQKQYDKAIEYYQLALSIVKELNFIPGISACLTNLAGIYGLVGKFDLATSSHQEALELKYKQGDKLGASRVLNGLGIIHNNLKRYDSARNYFEKAHGMAKELGNVELISRIEFGLAISIFHQGNYKESVEILKGILIYIESTPSPELAVKVHKRLSQTYQKLGEFENALTHAHLHSTLSDSLYNEKIIIVTNDIEAKYQNEQKQKEIELLNANNNINELQLENKIGQRNVLIITTVAFFGLMMVLYNRNKIKSKAHVKLQELDQMKSKFFTNISHEFRTPLTLILGPVDNLLDQDPSEESEESLLIIKRNAHRLLELINQLLDLSKLEAKQLKLKLTKSDIHQFLHTQVSLFQSLTKQREIQLHINIPHEPLELDIDTDKLQKILSNLLSNAVKFTARGGSIDVSTTYTEKAMEVTVKDSGQGIPSDELPHIFKRFHQLDSSHQHNGTGVGLTLVKELVELHQGTVKVLSEYGQGTEFIIALPLSIAGFRQVDSTLISHEPTPLIYLPTEHENRTTLSSSIDEEASTVLVVEDNKEVSEYITSLFSDHYQVLSAVNGKEGLDTALRLVPDIIITDLMMPLMDGVELCAKLKKDERTSHIPVIMLTAMADVDSRIEGLENGADDYLTKPFEQKELKVRMQNLIDQRDILKTHYSKYMTLAPSQIEVTPPDQVFLEKIMNVVEDKMSDVEFTVVQLQQEMAMSRMQLHRKLKALTGLSASEFVRNQRLMRAAEILKIEGMAVAEVAYSTGFNNLSYFAKCFKEKYAISPSKYPNS